MGTIGMSKGNACLIQAAFEKQIEQLFLLVVLHREMAGCQLIDHLPWNYIPNYLLSDKVNKRGNK